MDKTTDYLKSIELKYDIEMPADFDEKWKSWIKEIDDIPNEIRLISEEEKEFGRLYCFYFRSVNGIDIYCRLYKNKKAVEEKRPVVFFYHGHGNGIEEEWNVWHSMNYVNGGFSVVAIDIRNQNNKSIDNDYHEFSDKGNMASDILNLEQSYIKLAYQDSVKIVDIVKKCSNSIFDGLRDVKVFLAGPSQGGGLVLSVASLREDVDAICADIPSGCFIKSRVLGNFGMYRCINEVLDENNKEKIFHNLSYFDNINLVKNLKAKVFASIGTIDNICPPQFFYKAYQNIKSEKQLVVYYGYGHGGFEEMHLPKKIEFLNNCAKED